MTHFVYQHEAIPLLTPDFKHDLALDSALLLSKSEFGVPKVEMKIVDRNFFYKRVDLDFLDFLLIFQMFLSMSCSI